VCGKQNRTVKVVTKTQYRFTGEVTVHMLKSESGGSSDSRSDMPNVASKT
jgi:hypothetical protein